MCTQMASSKVMAARSQPNPDPPRQPPASLLNLRSDHSQGLGSMNIEDIMRDIYSDYDSIALENSGGGAGVRNGEPAMTLEDFLAKAGAVNEEDVGVRFPAGVTVDTPAVVNPGVAAVQFAPEMCMQSDLMTTAGYGVEFGNGIVTVSCGGRGKRMAAVEEVLQQKQRRMIKNRESAARSRERKQAYTLELEALVTQLEEDNARLLTEEAQSNKERYKQLMKKLIPVVEKQGGPRVLKRVHSMEW